VRVLAGSLLIMVSQLKYFFGISVPPQPYAVGTIWYLLTHLGTCPSLARPLGSPTVASGALAKPQSRAKAALGSYSLIH
jgi:hypothetical protein